MATNMPHHALLRNLEESSSLVILLPFLIKKITLLIHWQRLNQLPVHLTSRVHTSDMPHQLSPVDPIHVSSRPPFMLTTLF